MSTSPSPSTAPSAQRDNSTIRNVPLSRAERQARTSELLTEAANARDPGDRRALVEEVVVLNMPVARSIAHRFRNKGVNEEDLDQVAFMALTRAAQNFHPSHDRDFLTYAVPTIRGELKKYFRDSGWTVRPPRRVQELQGRIAAARGDLTQSLGRSPRPSEIAEALDEELDHVLEALSTDGCFHPVSLDRPVTEHTTLTIGDSLGDDSVDLSAAEARLTLAPLVRNLSERDRRILDLRFFRDATQQEIADDIGVTQMHVSRLISRILAELRDQLSHEAVPSKSA
jgi:RNA polymerase sigma-B factor